MYYEKTKIFFSKHHVRSKFIAIFLLSLFLFPHTSSAFTVTVLKSSNIRPYLDALDGFKKSCNCRIYEFAYNDLDSVNEHVRNTRPDAVLAIGLDAFKNVQMITDVPVISLMTPLPHSKTLSKNIAGVDIQIPLEKQLATLLDIFPNTKKVGVIYNPKNTQHIISEMEKAADSKKIELIYRRVSKTSDVLSAIDSLQDKIDVFWMIPDTTVISNETVNHLLLFSFSNMVPVFSFSSKYIEAGAVAGLVIEPHSQGLQAGEIAKKIFFERKDPSQLRQAPQKNILLINSKVAGKLGIKISSDIKNRAKEVGQ